MTRSIGEYEQTLTIAVPIDLVEGHLDDLEAIAGAYEELERWERVDELTLGSVLTPITVSGRGDTGAVPMSSRTAYSDGAPPRTRGPTSTSAAERSSPSSGSTVHATTGPRAWAVRSTSSGP